MEPDRLSRELADLLVAARMTAEALSLDAELARDTVGRWRRGTTVPTLAALQAVESVLTDRLGYPIDLAVAVRERRSAQLRERQCHTDLAALIAYLEGLIGGLNADPWPTDTQLRGPRLTPAAIERKLRVRIRLSPGD